MGDGLDDRGVGGKTGSALLDNLLPIQPDAELTASARLEIGLQIQLFLDERRHTGGARQIISNDAVTDPNPVHTVPMVPERSKGSKGFVLTEFQNFWNRRRTMPLELLEPLEPLALE